MYSWYENSAVCYTWLGDVSEHNPRSHLYEDEISESRWFTRGWTLQELIAPKEMHFFNKDWKFLGDKRTLLPILTKVTKIPHNVLKDSSQRTFSSVARKMSWAGNRETTRVEDVAYSLFGIFEVNMPLLYGEGQRAFIRLQEEILKETSDQSILAWNPIDSDGMYLKELSGSVLAASPKAFVGSENVVSFPSTAGRQPHLITNRGLRIEAPILTGVSRSIMHNVAILDCHLENDFSGPIGIPLFETPEGSVFLRRLRDGKITKYSTTQVEGAEVRMIYIAKHVPEEIRQCPNTCVIRAVSMKAYGYDLVQVVPRPSHESMWFETNRVLRMAFENVTQSREPRWFKTSRMLAFGLEDSIKGIKTRHTERSSAAFIFYNGQVENCCVIMCAVYSEIYTGHIRTSVKIIAKLDRTLLKSWIEDWISADSWDLFKGFEYEEATIPTEESNATIGARMAQAMILNQKVFVLDIGIPK
jgi:hypothetical protein